MCLVHPQKQSKKFFNGFSRQSFTFCFFVTSNECSLPFLIVADEFAKLAITSDQQDRAYD
jgi:hypothetical protein